MHSPPADTRDQHPAQLRTGWTTGACATAATKAALTALVTGEFPDPVEITLPGGQNVSFALAFEGTEDGCARAGIVKDAGDDPDVTHGCLVIATARVKAGEDRTLSFSAGDGVGTVTRAGLPVAVGEPAINPVPRQMMTEVVAEIRKAHRFSRDLEIEISIRDGKALAEKTWNPRLGIIGGLSILGTTGIVRPFSCSAWIASIHRGIDVARAAGINHIAGATGATSEKAVKALHGLPDMALIDMGDFAGGMLKYLRNNPVPRVTIAGGLAKITKLAQGALDLHSGRSQVDFDMFAQLAAQCGADEQLRSQVQSANTVLHASTLLTEAGMEVAPLVAQRAVSAARNVLRDAPVIAEIVIVDREGKVVAVAGE